MFSETSDPYLIWAWRGGVVALSLTALLAVVIVLMRLNTRRQERRWNAFVAHWRPLLLGVMMLPDEPPTLPALPRRYRPHFLRLWVYLHESVRGEAAEQLNRAARVLQIDRTARQSLRWASRAQQLQAVLALGYLRDRPAWNGLLGLARQRDPLVSVNAARALIQIDPLAGAQALMPLILSRQDWDVSRVAAFLVEARDAFWLLLVRQLPQLGSGDTQRALRLADALRLKLPVNALQRLLEPAQPPAVVAAALRLLPAGDGHDALLRCLDHADFRVREAALQQLAQRALPDDQAAIEARLADPQWRVRMAAAQTLAELPFVALDDLLQRTEPGSPAHEVLRHVQAEQVWSRG